jgi:hypothetical protein
VPESVEVVTIDLSYLSLARAAPQLEALAIAAAADLVALVKPMFELGLARPSADPEQRAKAVELAAAAFENAGLPTAACSRAAMASRPPSDARMTATSSPAAARFSAAEGRSSITGSSALHQTTSATTEPPQTLVTSKSPPTRPTVARAW